MSYAIVEDLIKAIEENDIELAAQCLNSPDLPREMAINAQKGTLLTTACKNGHIKMAQFLLSSPLLTTHSHIHANDDAALISACQAGHLDLVKFLMNSQEIPENADPTAFDCRAFVLACTNHHLELAQYLYSLPQIHDYYDIGNILQKIFNDVYHDNNKGSIIKKTSNDANIDMLKFVINLEPIKKTLTQEYINSLFKDAFHNEYLEVAKYLANNNDLPFKAKNSDFAFIYAYESGNLDCIKYLLSCKDLHPATDIHIQQEGAFRTAVLQKRLDIIEYYIFDYGLQYNSEISIHLNLAAKKNPEFVKVVRNLFDLQQLNHDLHADLPQHQQISRKAKI